MSRCWLTSLPCPLRVNDSACVKYSIVLYLVVEKKWGGGGGKAEGMKGKESASWTATNLCDVQHRRSLQRWFFLGCKCRKSFNARSSKIIINSSVMGVSLELCTVQLQLLKSKLPLSYP